MSLLTPDKIVEITIKNGIKKYSYPLLTKLILGFQAGAFIALGFLLYIRVTAPLSESLYSIKTLLGASVFPIGLILTLIAGGELLTGNMMVMSLTRLANKIGTMHVIQNWVVITVSNFVGALFIAYLFGHVLGLTESGDYLENTVSIAEHKLSDGFLQAFISGIGCNWLVAAAVWLSYASNDIVGKVLGIWFPTMAFVAIGFQHVVANMFVIPAAIFAGYFTWADYISNFIPVFLGNSIGGAIFIALAYWSAYKKNKYKLIEGSMQSEDLGKKVSI